MGPGHLPTFSTASQEEKRETGPLFGVSCGHFGWSMIGRGWVTDGQYLSWASVGRRWVCPHSDTLGLVKQQKPRVWT